MIGDIIPDNNKVKNIKPFYIKFLKFSDIFYFIR